MSERVEEINGVAITKESDPSGPTWKWSTDARYGVIVHSAIQWLESSKEWRRGTAIEDKLEKGGWSFYPALYKKAEDETAAWEVVQATLEHELRDRPDHP